MSLASFYLIISVLSLLGTLAALIRARRLYYLIPLYFIVAWISGELALQRIAIQLVLSLVFIACGVLDSPNGQWALFLLLVSWTGSVYVHYVASGSRQVLGAALVQALGADYRRAIPAERLPLLRDKAVASEWLRPFSMKRAGVERIANIAYGEAGTRNLLDIYKPTEPREGGYPILLQVHGGAWLIGNKEQQALPLMYHLAQRGWLCVSINYRLSPRATFPEHIVDVKKAIAWIREHVAEYGGNSNFLAITGGSAGGHLSSLAALTPNKPEFQPGFEQANTAVDAAVPFYGVYDFLDRHDLLGDMGMDGFLAKLVFKCERDDNAELWEAMSSESHVNADAPPFFVIQGTYDSLVWSETADHFVEALRAKSDQAVAYAQVAGAQHAFDIFHCLRADNAVNAATDFLEWSYARHQQTSATES